MNGMFHSQHELWHKKHNKFYKIDSNLDSPAPRKWALAALTCPPRSAQPGRAACRGPARTRGSCRWSGRCRSSGSWRSARVKQVQNKLDDLRRGFTEDLGIFYHSELGGSSSRKIIHPPPQQLGPLLDLSATATGRKGFLFKCTI